MAGCGTGLLQAREKVSVVRSPLVAQVLVESSLLVLVLVVCWTVIYLANHQTKLESYVSIIAGSNIAGMILTIAAYFFCVFFCGDELISRWQWIKCSFIVGFSVGIVVLYIARRQTGTTEPNRGG
jgi:hypothetical protein